jgi:hypothetical protein
MCGGPGFKIYMANNDWLIVKGKTKHYVSPDIVVGTIDIQGYSATHKLIGSYVNLRYQPRDRQADIIAAFDTFLKTI